MRKNFAITVATAALLTSCLGSCANLEVHQLNPVPPPGAPQPSVSFSTLEPLKGQLTYFLPRTTINVALSLTVSKCGSLSTASPDEPDPDANSVFAFSVNATPAPVTEADPKYGYRIDYDKAQSWMKEIQFTVNTTPGKVLQSFNSQINDQAGPTMVSAITMAVQIAGAVMMPGAGAMKIQQLPPPQTHLPPLFQDYCSPTVNAALQKISDDQLLISKMNKRVKEYRTKIAGKDGPTPGKDDPTTVWSAAIAALQAEISAAKAKSLTQTWTQPWTPAAEDMQFRKSSGKEEVYVGVRQYPISQLLDTTKFFSDKGQQWYESPIPDNPSDLKEWNKLHAPLLLEVVLDSRTFFDEAHYTPKPGGLEDPLQLENPGGLVLRDPAIGIVQKCTPMKDSSEMLVCDKSKPVHCAWKSADNLCQIPSLKNMVISDGNPQASDDTTRASVSLPQFGRPLVFTAHSALWENASLNVTLNADGTIQSLGTHDLSTAAGTSGLGGLAAAAGAASTAETAHNTAVGAVNTANSNLIQLPDTINKARADCLTQAAVIVKAGGTAVPCQ